MTLTQIGGRTLPAALALAGATVIAALLLNVAQAETHPPWRPPMSFIISLVSGLTVLFAATCLLLGVILAVMFLIGRRDWASLLAERSVPALGVLLATAGIAAIVIYAARALLGA